MRRQQLHVVCQRAGPHEPSHLLHHRPPRAQSLLALPAGHNDIKPLLDIGHLSKIRKCNCAAPLIPCNPVGCAPINSVRRYGGQVDRFFYRFCSSIGSAVRSAIVRSGTHFGHRLCFSQGLPLSHQSAPKVFKILFWPTMNFRKQTSFTCARPIISIVIHCLPENARLPLLSCACKFAEGSAAKQIKANRQCVCSKRGGGGIPGAEKCGWR